MEKLAEIYLTSSVYSNLGLLHSKVLNLSTTSYWEEAESERDLEVHLIEISGCLNEMEGEVFESNV